LFPFLPHKRGMQEVKCQDLTLRSPVLVQTASETEPTKGKRKKKDESPPDVIPVSQVQCRQRLGGLLKHYYRKVA
jgi:hypothetical protein